MKKNQFSLSFRDLIFFIFSLLYHSRSFQACFFDWRAAGFLLCNPGWNIAKTFTTRSCDVSAKMKFSFDVFVLLLFPC